MFSRVWGYCCQTLPDLSLAFSTSVVFPRTCFSELVLRVFCVVSRISPQPTLAASWSEFWSRLPNIEDARRKGERPLQSRMLSHSFMQEPRPSQPRLITELSCSTSRICYDGLESIFCNKNFDPTAISFVCNCRSNDWAGVGALAAGLIGGSSTLESLNLDISAQSRITEAKGRKSTKVYQAREPSQHLASSTA